MQATRQVFVAHAGIRQVVLEPAPVGCLHGAGSQQEKVVFGQASNAQVAIELAFGRQHGRQGDASGFWQAAREHVIEISTCALTLEFMLGEVGDLDSAHRLAHGLYLSSHIVMGPGAPEGRLLVSVLRIIGKPENIFQAEALSPHRPLRRQSIVERSGFLAPALGQCLVRECHDEAAFVVLRRFDGAPVRRRETAEAGYVHGPHVDGGLAVDHPLGHAQAHAAALAETRHDAHGYPIVTHTGYRADHRIAVGSEGERTVDDVLDAGAL